MKTVVSYAYYENIRSMYNLDFFAQVGITNDPNTLFIIVINGFNCSIELPKYDNCIIIKRENRGFDFGAHRASIDYLLNLYKCNNIREIPFDYFIFMNDGVIGPFLPKYFPSNIPWTNIFTSQLNDKIKLIGTSLVCFAYDVPTGKGPHIESFCFCLDKIGLEIVMNTKTIFIDHKTKTEAVNNGEYGLSKAILNAGYSLDCLLYKYQNIDWSNIQNWVNVNNSTFPSRNNTYDNITIHPFEVVFHKWFWAYEASVNFSYVVKYKKWKLNEIINKKNFHATFGNGEFMINVTNAVSSFFVDGKLIIPIDYYNNVILQNIAKHLNVPIYGLNINIKGNSYQIPYRINVPVEIFIDNIFNIQAYYGCPDFKIEVVNKFMNTFIKNNKIIMPKDCDFNKCFNDVCPGTKKHLYIKINNDEYIVNGNNDKEIVINL